MQVEWYGQSAFRLSRRRDDGVRSTRSADMSAMAASRGMQFDYPPIEGVQADLLLVTHEHIDHNGVEAIGGRPDDPALDRGHARVAGRRDHGDRLRARRAGRAPRAARTRSSCSSSTGCGSRHFGDFGQCELRDEQAAAIGEIDLLFLPVGGGPTIGAEQATAIVERLSPRWVVPMHYRTPRIGFLETADAFLEGSVHVERLSEPSFDTEQLLVADGPLIVVPAVP